MNNDILNHFDELNSSFAFGKPKSEHPIGNLFTLLGESNKYIAGTYSALLKRPELFGRNASNLMYALDVGQTFRKDSLYVMFRAFMNKPPTTTEANIIFNWATYLKNNNEFVMYEPVFAKLNQIIKEWFAKKTINWKGHEVPIVMFKPVTYNAGGVNLIELLPYIAYIFTYHIYGLPYRFSDAYSSSSLKSYLMNLENWFAKCYVELYKEQGISLLNENLSSTEISDETWMNFYTTMLNADKLVAIRNEEINKTPNALDNLIADQQALSDKELAEKFNNVLSKLVEIASEESPYKVVYDKVPYFDSKYYDAIELSILTTYFITCTNKSFIIDANDYYRYIQLSDEFKPVCTQLTKPQINYGLRRLWKYDNSPFAAGDVVCEMLKGLIKEKFEAKRSDIFDDNPIYLNPSDLDKENLYPILSSLFVNGVWNSERSEMETIMKFFTVNPTMQEFINDLFNLHQALQLIYGNTTSSIITPIYIISMLNVWFEAFVSVRGNPEEFNPFIYLKQGIPDASRIIKIQNMLYALMILNNANYVKLVNNTVSYYYQILTSNPLIIQPYVQTFDDEANIYALGGVETYQYARYSNPILRAYGFLSHVDEINEQIYVLNLFSRGIKNVSTFELLEDKTLDEKSKVNTLIAASKKIEEPNHLFKWKFELEGTKLRYEKQEVGTFADLMMQTSTGQIGVLKYVLKFAFAQMGVKQPNERMRVKCIGISAEGKVSAHVQSTWNGYEYKGKFISLELQAFGDTKYLPIYAPACKVLTRNVSVIRPDNMRLITINTPATNTDMNNVYWIFTFVRKQSKFDELAESAQIGLQTSGYKPTEGSYMLTDRIQPIPRV